MKVIISRYDEDNLPAGRCEEFEVPVPAEGDHWTVMDVLDYIALHQDPSLAYYKHSACNHGICGRCTLLVNGKMALACLTIVDPSGELKLEPARGRPIVRHLVTLEPASAS